jgi:hypothetical protein
MRSKARCAIRAGEFLRLTSGNFIICGAEVSLFMPYREKFFKKAGESDRLKAAANLSPHSRAISGPNS